MLLMYAFFRFLLEKLEDTRHKSGHYVAAKVSKQTTADLKKWCNENKIPVSSEFFDNLHITLCYSSKMFPIKKDDVIDDIADWDVAPHEFTEFGQHKGKRFLVLKVKSKQCNDRWKHYMDQGASYDFDEYHPHITLAQDFDGDYKKLNLDTLPKLKLSSEYYEPLS